MHPTDPPIQPSSRIRLPQPHPRPAIIIIDSRQRLEGEVPIFLDVCGRVLGDMRGVF